MSRKKQEHTTLMPSSEELKTAGIRELTAQELLAVNGGKRTRKANSGGSSGGGSSGSSGSARGSSGGSSSSGRSHRSSGTSSSSNDSSKSNGKENKKPKAQSGTSAFDEKKSKPPVQSGTPSVNNPNTGKHKRNEEKQSGSMDYTVQKGDTLSGIVRKQYPGASKEEIVRKVKEAAANSGIADINKIEPGQKIIFEKPAQSSSGQPNAGEATSPTQGGAPRGKWQRPTNSGSSGSIGSTSGNSSGGSPSTSSGSVYVSPIQKQSATESSPPFVQQPVQQKESNKKKEQNNKDIVSDIKITATESLEKSARQESVKAPSTLSGKRFNAGSQLVAGNIVYNENNKTFLDTRRGSIKGKTKIVIQRSRGHTKGHYLSTLNVDVQSSDNTTVTLFSNSVHSWADRDKKLGDNDFTLQAGNYKGTLLSKSGSGAYEEPISLTNAYLKVLAKYGFLIHANEKTDGTKWVNTGSSEGCQILQGQMKTYRIFTQTLKSIGFLFNNKDVIDVQIKDPVGFYTTEYGKEISLNKGGNMPC